MNEDVKSENLRIHSRADELIACLEGEIAKRDEELAACRVAVENCDLFRARIAEFESRYQRDVWGLNNEGDPIGGDPAGGYANDNARLRSELAAVKAQDTVGEVVGWYRLDRPYEMTSYPSVCATWHKLGAPVAPLYAAPAASAADAGLVEALDRIARSAASHIEQGERPDLVTVSHWARVAYSAIDARSAKGVL